MQQALIDESNCDKGLVSVCSETETCVVDEGQS